LDVAAWAIHSAVMGCGDWEPSMSEKPETGFQFLVKMDWIGIAKSAALNCRPFYTVPAYPVF
jgi:hypothetical protein